MKNGMKLRKVYVLFQHVHDYVYILSMDAFFE